MARILLCLLALVLTTSLCTAGSLSKWAKGQASSMALRMSGGRTVKASWYGGKHHGGPTASGEKFNQNALTAAHKTLPFNTRIRVTNPANGKSVVVRINDRGPFTGGREIDLSYAAAKQIGILIQGVAKVKIEKL